MSPYELIRTQKGGRLYWLWEREKNPQKKQKYQEEFNKLLKAEEVDKEAENDSSK